MNPIHFRPATANDFDAVYRLCMHPSTNPYLAFDLVTTEAFLPVYTTLLTEGELIIIGEKENIVGCYHLFNKAYRQADTVYLATLVIDPAASGKGYGRTALQHIIQSMTQKKKNRIELEVSVNNEAAIRFYQKAGFIIEGTIRQSYRIAPFPDYYDDYLMSILLPPTQ